MKKYSDIILGVLGILYFSYLKLCYGGMTFSGFFLLIGLFLILYHFLKNKIYIDKKIKKSINIILMILLVIFLILESTIIFFQRIIKMKNVTI